MTDFRDYVYISTAKLNSLSRRRRRGFLHGTKRSYEIGAPPLKAVITAEAGSEALESLVKWVSDDLRRQDLVGTVDESKRYFGGVLPLKWGPYPNLTPAVVFFLGATDSTVLALGGRAIHAPGWDGAPAIGNPTPALSELAAVNAIAEFKLGQPRIHGQILPTDLAHWYDSLFALDEAMLGADAEEFEFLAVRHAMEDGKDPTGRHRGALLGSPIYVARVS